MLLEVCTTPSHALAQEERRALEGSGMSEAEQAQHRGRLAQLDLFKERSACLSSAANLLEQGMATLKSQVGAIQLTFGGIICICLIPSA